MPISWPATRAQLQAARHWSTASRLVRTAVPEAASPVAAWMTLLALAPDDPFWLSGIIWQSGARLLWSTTPVLAAGWGAQALARVPGLARAWATAHAASPQDRDRPLLWLLPYAAGTPASGPAARGSLGRGIYAALRDWHAAGWLTADSPVVRLLDAYLRQFPGALPTLPNPVPYEPVLFNRFHPLARWFVRLPSVHAGRLVALMARNPTFTPLALDAPATDASVVTAAILEAGNALGQQPSVVAALLRRPEVRATPPVEVHTLWATYPGLLSSLLTHLLVEVPGTTETAAVLAWLVAQHGAPAVATAVRVSDWTRAARALTARGAWIRAQFRTPGFVDLWVDASGSERVALLTRIAPIRPGYRRVPSR